MEFKVYDAAFAKQYENGAIKAMPLVSWDIYSQFLLQTNVLLHDVNSLHQMANKNQWKSVWDYKESLQDETVIVVFCFSFFLRTYSVRSIFIYGLWH